MPIIAEPATVYRFKNRRFMSRSSAYRGAAKMLMNERCYCEPGDYETGGGHACRYHGASERGENYPARVFNRLVRHLKYCAHKNLAV